MQRKVVWMKPKFSVIVPLYNKAPYVRKALESVCAQTCTDWECIVVDDGSTDGSAEIAQEYADRVTIIRQANAGVAVARNKGVAASEGEYLCFLDADDWWKPESLEEMNRLIEAYPEAGIYATNYIYVKTGKTHVALRLPTGTMDYPKAYMENVAMPVTSITACMPRKIFDEMGGFSEGIQLGEDFLLWAKTAMHYSIAYSEKPMAYYNNDIPASHRATRNLHRPEQHMLFNLEEIEQEIARLKDANQQAEWYALLDTLRVDGLMDYWLSDAYHEAAERELAKVTHGKERYATPIWLLKAKRLYMQMGSWCKQVVLKTSTK